MAHSQYIKCITPYMKGIGKTKEQRQMDVCIGAKICSNKAKTEEEAKVLCSLPKEPKPRKKRQKLENCQKEVMELATCVIKKIDMKKAINVNTLQVALTNAMMECRCPR